MKIFFTNYGQYSSPGQGAHTMCLNVDDLQLFYSYDTIVAFNHPSTGMVVSENRWSVTTGRHLNWIDYGAKGRRIHGYEFDLKLKTLLEKLGLEVT